MAGDFNTKLTALEGVSRGGYCGVHCDLQDGGHVHVLPPTPQTLGAVREDVVHVMSRDVGAVPDGFSSGKVQLSVSECLHL